MSIGCVVARKMLGCDLSKLSRGEASHATPRILQSGALETPERELYNDEYMLINVAEAG